MMGGITLLGAEPAPPLNVIPAQAGIQVAAPHDERLSLSPSPIRRQLCDLAGLAIEEIDPLGVGLLDQASLPTRFHFLSCFSRLIAASIVGCVS